MWFQEHNVCNGGVLQETGKLTGSYNISMFGFKPLTYILNNSKVYLTTQQIEQNKIILEY